VEETTQERWVERESSVWEEPEPGGDIFTTLSSTTKAKGEAGMITWTHHWFFCIGLGAYWISSGWRSAKQFGKAASGGGRELCLYPDHPWVSQLLRGEQEELECNSWAKDSMWNSLLSPSLLCLWLWNSGHHSKCQNLRKSNFTGMKGSLALECQSWLAELTGKSGWFCCELAHPQHTHGTSIQLSSLTALKLSYVSSADLLRVIYQLYS
jgi:hypothetical protein